jgi:hypothetical protein
VPRSGGIYGPDVTFLGVEGGDVDDLVVALGERTRW